MVNVFYSSFCINIFYTQRFFSFIDTSICKLYSFMFFIYSIVNIFHEITNYFCKNIIKTSRISSRSRNNKWRSSFIYKNRVYFIHNSKVVSTLSQIIYIVFNIISQIIKTIFIICSISNIG